MKPIQKGEMNIFNVIYDFSHSAILYSIDFDHLIEVEKIFYNTLQTYWKEHNYLTPQWWFLVILSIASPITWYKLVDKKRITEITSFGLFYGMAAIILDSIGSNAMLWLYPVRLTPFLDPQVYPYDVGIVIIPFMMIYQKWGKYFKKFFLFSGLLSAFLAFMAEPFMEWLHIYKAITWKHIYSFLLYWLISLICWLIIKKFKKLEQKP